MKLTVPPLEIDPNEGFSSDKDIFERQRFGKNLLNIIENIKDELVIAVDAPWGEGKTTFMKMWRGMLAQEEVPSIYFDAFENDYQADPFLAIAAEIYSIIDDEEKSAKLQFKKKTISALKTLNKLCKNDISYEKLIDETSLETFQDESWLISFKIDGHPLKFMLRCCLSSKEETKNLIKQTVDNPQLAATLNSQINKNILRDICKWMNTFDAA